jgi:uncharacterized protein YjiS (DUF1127 family)
MRVQIAKHPQPSWWGAAREGFRRWRQRRRDRDALASMSAMDLRDLGISRYDALRELGKPWWRA